MLDKYFITELHQYGPEFIFMTLHISGSWEKTEYRTD